MVGKARVIGRPIYIGMEARRAFALVCIIGAVASSALNGCAGRPRVGVYSNLAVNYNLKLPSGETVVITDTHGDSFEDINHVHRHIYYIAYDTSHDFEDLPALHQEALRVWAAYLPQVVGIDYDSAVVTAEKPGTGEGRPMYLKRLPDGTWQVQ